MNSLRVVSLLCLLSGGIATSAPLQEIVQKTFPLSPNTRDQHPEHRWDDLHLWFRGARAEGLRAEEGLFERAA